MLLKITTKMITCKTPNSFQKWPIMIEEMFVGSSNTSLINMKYVFLEDLWRKFILQIRYQRLNVRVLITIKYYFKKLYMLNISNALQHNTIIKLLYTILNHEDSRL